MCNGIKRILSRRRYTAGYEVRTELMEDNTVMRSAYTIPEGWYIGNSVWAHRLCRIRGVKPELISPDHKVCSIGFSESRQRWYAWSHRGLAAFEVGCIVDSEDHLCTLASEELRLPVGFEAKTLDDVKRMAIAFADAIS